MTAKKASEILYSIKWALRTDNISDLQDRFPIWEMTEALSRGTTALINNWEKLPEGTKLALLEMNKELEITDKDRFEAQKIMDEENIIND